MKNAFRWFKSRLGGVTKHDLEKLKDQIMSAISDYAARVNAKFDQISTAIDGVSSDVTELKALIEKLQNSPGTITPEDQAALDALELRVNSAAEKLTALDLSTPPAAP